MKWQPWVDCKEYWDNKIHVDAPPCVECKYWRPAIRTDMIGNYVGVVLCRKIDRQYKDFSCYLEEEK